MYCLTDRHDGKETNTCNQVYLNARHSKTLARDRLNQSHLNLATLRVLVLDDRDGDSHFVEDGKGRLSCGLTRGRCRCWKSDGVVLRVESVLILLEGDESFESKPK